MDWQFQRDIIFYSITFDERPKNLDALLGQAGNIEFEFIGENGVFYQDEKKHFTRLASAHSDEFPYA